MDAGNSNLGNVVFRGKYGCVFRFDGLHNYHDSLRLYLVYDFIFTHLGICLQELVKVVNVLT